MAKAKSKSASRPPADRPRVGDLVRIRYYPDVRARVVELRGALGPGGAHVYRLLLRRKPVRAYVEVLEEQIEVIRRAADESPH